MPMKGIGALVTGVVLGLVLTACRGGGTGNLKQIAQQRVGEYVVTLLNDTGQLKLGRNKSLLEFRRAADNQLVDVGNVQLTASMPMQGMPDMSGAASATPSGTPGRYDVAGDFSMPGMWNLMVTFGRSQHVPFALTVP
jgi:hypothetical protein